VFQEVKAAISEYLAGQHVDVRKVEEADSSALAVENLKITHAEAMPDVLQKARLVGASHVLFLTVDRPMKSWVKLKMQCFDLSGTVLWEETTSNGTSLSGGGGLKSALKRMQDRLAARIGQPGLVVQGVENTSATQPAAENVAGHSPPVTAQAQALQKESGPGGSPANQASTAGPEPGQIRPSAIAQDATVVLPEGTPVRLMLIAPVNSMTASVGDKVEFRVLEDVKATDLVVIPRKAVASGVVTELAPPRRRQRPGRITVKAETVSLINNQAASLRGLRTLQSGNRNVDLKTQAQIYDTLEATQGLGLFFLPLFMLKHGEYVVLPAGMEFAAVLDHSITIERTALLQAQPAPAEKHHGNPVVTVYHVSNPPSDRPKLYCGKAELARLQNGTAFQLTLPPGTYWFRSNNKKHLVPLTLEDGGEYYLRVDSLMTWGNPSNPGYSQFLRVRDHDIGEIEAAAASPLDPKNIKDISKIDSALLNAGPK
jgi:hypothetical protein